MPIGKHFIHSQQNIKVQIDLAKYSSSQLSNYLANVTSIQENDLESLEALSEQFPYCQIFQFFAAKAAQTTTNFEYKLEIATIHAPSRAVLCNLIHHPEGFENKIVEGANNLSEEASGIGHRAIDNQPILNEELIEETHIEIETIGTEESKSYSTTPIVDSPQLEAHINIETYDHHDSVLIKTIEEEAILAVSNQDLGLHNASSPQPEAHGSKPEARSPQLEVQSSQHNSNPTLYNDNTLPFSFLWWLNKTRKEHCENNQPYASPLPEARSSEPNIVHNQQLNFQIAESVLQHSVLDAYKDVELPSQSVTQEDHIIKKFISEEPQIKPMPANKIDTENKAKKSSADGGELVSETLAKIYVEQMLYAKALDTYKKLSLKYPEKSTYFASQIKYLELKAN